MPANPAVVAYIRDAATRRGIDPEVALRVAGAEALNVFDPNKPDLGGDDHSSFGMFQLHYGGLSRKMPNPGLGDEFTRATGLDARDPSTWRQQVDFSLDWAKRHGWGSWMGAKAAGVSDFAGISGAEPRVSGPVEAAGGGFGSDKGAPQLYTPPPSSPTAVAQTDYDKLFDELLASRPREARRGSLLADDLASSVGRRRAAEVSTSPVTDKPIAPLEIASALPEEPLSTVPVGKMETPSLAELFTVKEIGMPHEIDPLTGQIRPFRSRRAYG
jgi:hypothetical protein